MKKLYPVITFLSIILFSFVTKGQSGNNYCNNSLPFCTGITYNNPAGVNTSSAETGPNYMCLYSQPNPAWYYLQIAQPGDISIDIHTVPQHDVDFICWGPFTDPTSPCINDLTGIGSPGSHWAAGPGGGYPAGNTVDCSYNSSWQEWCYIPNGQPGEYYIFMITNYSNQACNIIFNQITGSGSTYCGPAEIINGKFFFDINNNNILDSTDSGVPNAILLAPSCGYYSQTDTAGDYIAYICNSPDTVWPYYNNPYTSIVPPFQELTGSTTNVNFAVTMPPNIYDISTTLTNYVPARPGFNFPCLITLTNMGTEQSCGTLSLTFDTIFDSVSSNPPADTIIGNTLIWDNTCTPLFQTNNFYVNFHVDSTITIGTPYLLYANFNNLQTDTTPLNNIDTITGAVVGSYDPNDKQANPDGLIENSAAFAEQEIEYTIRFQNTGTYQATNIRLLDTLSTWLQIPTFTLLSSSHPCTYNISENGIVQFYFNNINLPDINSDETGSHGFVKFKLNCKPALGNGGDVFNTAYIYFDYNAAIVTNTTLTYTKLATYIPTNKKHGSYQISINPNPARDNVTLNINYYGNEDLIIEVNDVLGKTVLKQINYNKAKKIDLNISELKAGTYTIKVSSSDFSSTEQLIIY